MLLMQHIDKRHMYVDSVLLVLKTVIPLWPLDQSYETAYAKMVPLRLNVVALMGPGAASKAKKRYNQYIPKGRQSE
jgi:hypothetical protein